MANIESKLSTIRSASGGEDVRDAIIGALRDINNDVPADMSNPEDYRGNMASGSDYSDSFNPPKLIRSIYIQQPNTGGKSMKLETIDITRNGKYPTDDPNYDPDEEIRYYKEVNVKVPQLANSIEMETVEITANGLYDATEWGVDGLRSINVNIQGTSGDGPFVVNFYDKPIGTAGATIIETQLAAKGASVACTKLDGTVDSSGNGFKGWSPSPMNITRDMDCYPTYSQVIITPGSISEDWDVIALDGGAHYPLQSHKSIQWALQTPAITVGTYSGGTIDIPAGNVSIVGDFYKVAEGESGSHSTWLLNTHVLTSSFGNIHASAYSGQGAESDWWGTSPIKQWLNNALLAAFPDALKANIKEVTKTSLHRVSGTWIDETSSDRIWIPSAKEYGAMYEALLNSPDVASGFIPPRTEYSGIDYTSIYMSVPQVNNGVRLLRSWGIGQEGGWKVTNAAMKSNGVDIYTGLLRAEGYINSTESNGYVIGFCL